MKVLISAGDLSGNSLGRAYCIWLLIKELGGEARVLGSGRVWRPLVGTEFSEHCAPIEDLEVWTRWADIAIAYQPLPETLGTLLGVGIPLLVDIDEPHWQARYGFERRTRLKVMAARLRDGRNPFTPGALLRRARFLPTLVSNPGLLDLYPGSTVVPHVRPSQPQVPMPSGPPRVAFIGTHRRHKGVEVLRRAAQEAKVALVLTGMPPDNALPNETWVGTTTLEQGRKLLQGCHAAAVLSDRGPFSDRQLPVKAIDAMMAGRVVLGSRTPPLQWAVGNVGLLVEPDDDHVVTALRALTDDSFRRALGWHARERAEALFTPVAVAPALRSALAQASQPERGKGKWGINA